MSGTDKIVNFFFFFFECHKQELVNLLLTGKAVSNVFDDVIELNSGNGNITILKGITSRSDIGLLSLFEHYDVCQVCFAFF